jgi:hypothetical protein
MEGMREIRDQILWSVAVLLVAGAWCMVHAMHGHWSLVRLVDCCGVPRVLDTGYRY